MAITSKISAKPVFGSNPAGWTPLVPNNDGELAYISGSTLTGVFDFLESSVSYTPNDIPATQEDFLLQVQTYLDGTYMPSVFTDATKDYDARYTITNIQFVFENTNGESGSSIWSERTWIYKTTIKIEVNIN
jgi:hypothetical protein